MHRKEADKVKSTSEYRGYISTPNGSLLEQDPWVASKEPAPKNGNNVTVVATDIPSDPNSDEPRKNNISPNVTPNVMPKITVNGTLLKDSEIKLKN